MIGSTLSTSGRWECLLSMLLLLAVGTSWGPCTNSTLPQEFFRVSVFDCMWPIPTSFALGARSEDELRFFAVDDDVRGAITIWSGVPEVPEEGTVRLIERRTAMGLTVRRFEADPKELGFAGAQVLQGALVDDGNDSIHLLGSPVQHLDWMLRYCKDTRLSE